MNNAYIYNDLVRLYNRSRKKLQRLLAEGKNHRRQDILQRRIARLVKKLTGLQRALKLGMATAALTAGMLLFQPDAAQAQEITFRSANLGLTNIGYGASPAFADLDGDGDLDLMTGDFYGNFHYFENAGTAPEAAYTTPQTNPFGLTGVAYYSAPAFADLDGDGDLDMMVGNSYGSFFYYENTGTASAPAYAAPITNPFGLTALYRSIPTFTDLDSDGDLDMMAGDRYGNFYYFQNNGTAAAPAYAAPLNNPFELSDIGINAAPAFADLDSDGDLDMMAGSSVSSFYYFENTGTPAAPVFAPVQTNPFGLSDVGTYSAPVFVDLDNDGDLDMMAGEVFGNFYYFQNTGTAAAPAYVNEFNQFGFSNIGRWSAPAFADLDNDGDQDLMAGDYYGDFYYFENTGTNAAPAYAAVQTNPFGLSNIGADSSPTFADLDNDGDLDLLSGEYYSGFFFYFENTGTATAPVYAAPQTNPFGLSFIGNGSTPAFADLDGDGDQDLMAGSISGSFSYFENTGTNAAPDYAAPQTNPFGLSDIGVYSIPTFDDLDNDGDQDMMVGEEGGSFFYFQNIGTVSAPAYAAPQTNPFGLSIIGNNSAPAFADLDNDGDQDLMTGGSNGNFFYFENITTFVSGVAVANGIGVFNLFPNPATDQVTVQFTLSEPMQVAVKIVDLSGREMSTLLKDQLQEGAHSIQLNTATLVQGVYMVNIGFGNGAAKNVKLIVQ